MKDRINNMRQFFITDKKHITARQKAEEPYILAKQFEAQGIPDTDRAALRLIYVLNNEKPIIFGDEHIAFTRTITAIPELFTDREMKGLKEKHWIHEKGDVCNICADYTKLLHIGLIPRKEELERMKSKYLAAGETDKAHYTELQINILDSILALAERYRILAEEEGNDTIAKTLAKVPAKAPETFAEALQMFRILHFVMWCGRNYHNTIGRFDQFMYPYLQKDLENGILDEESAFELLEEFFLTFNRDSDLYPGMQQGDNGQSLVLGGLNEDGSDSYNLLSEMCLNASLELKLIDPKINLRVHKNTSMETYILAAELTKQGLGFPQYSNDEIVIPGLLNLGYEKKDAYNYVVAACWEFIIPGAAMDIPNIEALSFTKAVESAVMEKLMNCHTYEAFAAEVSNNIKEQADELCEKVKNIYIFPAPFISLMMDGCSDNANDISLGCKYNNYGFHGTGIATAADSMAAIKKYIYDEKTLTAQEMIEALKNNFEGNEILCNKLRYETPKMGNNDDTLIRLLPIC